MLYTNVASMNKDEVYDENLANCEHKHKFHASDLFLDTDTMLFWNGTCRSLHLFHIAQLDQLKFQILSEQKRKNRHIRIPGSHSCSFHKTLPCTSGDDKISRLCYERMYRHLLVGKSFS